MIFCLQINNDPTARGVYNAVENLMARTGNDPSLAVATSAYGLATLCPMYQDLFNEVVRREQGISPRG